MSRSSLPTPTETGPNRVCKVRSRGEKSVNFMNRREGLLFTNVFQEGFRV